MIMKRCERARRRPGALVVVATAGLMGGGVTMVMGGGW
jgi:hypothetical protein